MVKRSQAERGRVKVELKGSTKRRLEFIRAALNEEFPEFGALKAGPKGFSMSDVVDYLILECLFITGIDPQILDDGNEWKIWLEEQTLKSSKET